MNIKAMDCPHCNAPVEYTEGTLTVKCPYCGSTLHIDDGIQRTEHHIKQTVNYRDEARLLELELKKKELEQQQLEEQEWREKRDKAFKRWKIILLIFAILEFICGFALVFYPDSSLGGLMVLLVAIPFLYPRKYDKHVLSPVVSYIKWFFITLFIEAGAIAAGGYLAEGLAKFF